MEPRGIALTPAGEVVVCDSGNKRVQILSSIGGREIMTFGGGGQLQNPCGVAVDPDTGDYYVSDFGGNAVHR